MSKVGKKPIEILKGVEVTLNGASVTVKGPKATFTKEVPRGLTATVADNALTLTLTNPDEKMSGKRQKQIYALWGLYRALIANMIKGAADGFEKKLEFEGVGYKAAVKGSDLELNLGYSHPITITAPTGITFKVEKNVITVEGADKELVGHVAANIRSKRLPEPYQGSGIRYAGEHIRRKAGKKAGAGA